MKKLTTIELVEGDGPPTIHWVGTKPDAERLEWVIGELGNMRRDTAPPVSMEFPLGRVKIDRDVSFLVGQDPTGRALMSFRHPGFGWCTFHLSPDMQKYLVQVLGEL